MERCNNRIKIERERSKERMRMVQARGHSVASEGRYKDKANLSDEKINNETEIVNSNSTGIPNVRVLN